MSIQEQDVAGPPSPVRKARNAEMIRVGRPRIVHLDFSGYGVMTHVLSFLDHADHDAYEHMVIYATDDRRPGVDSYGMELAVRGIENRTVPVRQNITPDDLLALARAMQRIRKADPSILHCHSTKAGTVGRLCAAALGRIPTVYTPHSFSFQMADRDTRRFKVLLGIEKFLGRLTNRIAAVSETEFRLAVDEGICTADRTALIPNGVDCKRLAEARSRRCQTRAASNIGQDEIVICFIGRFAPQKMPNVVVETAACLKKRGIKPVFLLLGNGPLEQDIQNLIASLGLKDQCRWLGWRQYDEALDFLAASDIMLLPSRYEGLPYVALEAQAAGVVPIMTRVPGSSDAVVDGVTGLLVPLGDVSAIADAVQALIYDPHRLRDVSQAGQNYVRERYSADLMARRIEALYADVLDGPSRKS